MGQLLLSPRHHRKQTVLWFPRNIWNISSHMVHTPFSKPPFRFLHASVSLCSGLFFFFFFFLHSRKTHSRVLEVCILSSNHSSLMLCVSTNGKAGGWSYQASVCVLFFTVPHLFVLSSPSLFISLCWFIMLMQKRSGPGINRLWTAHIGKVFGTPPPTLAHTDDSY